MRNRPIVQLAATAVAAIFILVAVLGFVPGITTDYSDLSLAGRESEAELVGLFQINVLHNIVHGLFGVIGLVLARSVVDPATACLAAASTISSCSPTASSSIWTAQRTSCL